ncbi:aldehyde dehydrogenase [Dendrothele bispora CBS 962.96]|uniref:aldehyde dehydrogenase (NAD(+)) n=1 Tax=Dendrothele bispora (strain CBS 962.96) TaxID=1314807 RepID=A0A4S8KZ42_DENBC|nr:aldehyde dehydrogenase [Dendrothele bispora CBS 962.96]
MLSHPSLSSSSDPTSDSHFPKSSQAFFHKQNPFPAFPLSPLSSSHPAPPSPAISRRTSGISGAIVDPAVPLVRSSSNRSRSARETSDDFDDLEDDEDGWGSGRSGRGGAWGGSSGFQFGKGRTTLDVDIAFSTDTICYYSGWADKIHGQVMETDDKKLMYSRHEPIGVVGQIIPLLMWIWKIGPALATGNTVVLKPSEFTPLTAIYMCSLIQEAGFPHIVVNIVTGYGHTVGNAISSHMKIEKVALTLVGRKIMENAAKNNLKNVTLELGGKSPNIIFNDADLEQAINWSLHACCAGSRIFVQSGIYDKFLAKFTERPKDSRSGPQVSQQQYDRIMSYIDSGKEEGATVDVGGERVGNEGYFIQPTIFPNTEPLMKIIQEEIFGLSDDDIVHQVNDTMYGLASAVFSQDINKALTVTHRLRAGTAWVNCANTLNASVPFGGYKQSGIGRELGEYALHNYTSVKAVHVNLIESGQGSERQRRCLSVGFCL